jgi:hypothetical protein
MSRILILSASPHRDKVIDDQIAHELRKMGNEVWVRACLREGRPAVLELKPDVVVLPPIRNPYSRDVAEQLKKWGCGVITRHTEASCDWKDYKKMTPEQQQGILGVCMYFVDVELVWSSDEAQILNKRPARFKAIPVGALTCDIYMRDRETRKAIAPTPTRAEFNKKYKFSGKKKNLLIACPWGFADAAPDLRIDDLAAAAKEDEAKAAHIAMIKAVQEKLSDKWNVLVTLHPGIKPELYTKELTLPIDTESTSYELLSNADALIHGGSTMAINAHQLNIPAFQFQDQNCFKSYGWFDDPDTALSRISPKFTDAEKLIKAFKGLRRKSNANKKQLAELAAGRYGAMDGKATLRSAEIINQVSGKFVMCWPDSTYDYNQPGIAYKKVDDCLQQVGCNVCKHTYYVVKENTKQADSFSCPWCCARTFAK